MMSYESTWKHRKKRRKAKDGKSGAAGNASPFFFCFMERVPLPIKVVLSKQGKSGMMREKSSGKEEKKQLRKNFQKK